MPKEIKDTGPAPTPPSIHSPGRVALFGESRAGGTLIREQAIRANVGYLEGLQPLVEQAGSYSALLSGESDVSKILAGQGMISDKSILNGLGIRDPSYLTFGAALAGPNYRALKSESPLDRYKFYSSLDLTSPEQVAMGEEWFTEIAQRAHALNITLTTKTFDHAYDSLNLYTWHPAALAGIIQDLYPTYVAKGLYHSTPRFFQGGIEGVDPNHVGFVQEPVEGWPPNLGGHSHSGRMRVLGAAVDTYMQSQQGITSEQFSMAAEQAGVRPDAPYLIAA